MAEPTSYKRLPGSGGNLFQRYRLWLGADHLLLVGASVVGERYKRFYFTDIQAIETRRTGGYLWYSILFFLVTAFWGWVGTTADEEAARYIFWGIGGIFLILLLVHLALGPTCRCHIKTAVQFEHVPALSRVRSLYKLLEKVRPLIEAAQAGQAAPANPVSAPVADVPSTPGV